MSRPLDSHLYFAAQLEGVDCFAFAGGQAAVFVVPGPFREGPNQDSAGLIGLDETSGLLVIADGVGGQQSGERASRLTIETLAEELASGGEEDPTGAILQGIDRANARVSELAGPATTLATVLIEGSTMRSFHAGDSMILLTGQRGKVKARSVSHSPVGYAVEAGLLDEREAIHHEERHLVSNIVGSPDMRIEIGPSVELAARDTLLLASDGLFDNLFVEEIVERIRCGPLEKVATELADAARERMVHPDEGLPSKADDLSFILYRPGR